VAKALGDIGRDPAGFVAGQNTRLKRLIHRRRLVARANFDVLLAS